jgi:hypothetical protein
MKKSAGRFRYKASHQSLNLFGGFFCGGFPLNLNSQKKDMVRAKACLYLMEMNMNDTDERGKSFERK